MRKRCFRCARTEQRVLGREERAESKWGNESSQSARFGKEGGQMLVVRDWSSESMRHCH
jgi:hypothetical protein